MFTKLSYPSKCSVSLSQPPLSWVDIPTYDPLAAPHPSLSLSRPKFRCTSKLKTKMVIHMRGFFFSHCRCLNGPHVELQEISRLKQQKNVVPATSQDWKLSHYLLLLLSPHWCLIFLELSIGYTLLFLPFLAAAQIAGWLSKMTSPALRFWWADATAAWGGF